MAVSRSERLLFRPGAIALFGASIALLAPVVSFLLSPAASTLDRVLGWIAPVLLLASVMALPRWWESNDWESRDVTVQFLWFLLGVSVLGSAAVVFTLYVHTQGGSIVHPWFAVNNWAIGGGVVGLLLGLYDRSHYRALEDVETAREEAERYGEQVEVLNRVLRHDIRNGVNIIQGHADIVETTTTDAAAADSATVIEAAAGDLYELSEHARRLEVALDEPDDDTVSIATMLQIKIDQLRERCPDAELDCTLDTSASITGPTRLDIAFDQLLGNAVDHHPGTPRVRIEAHDADDGFVEVVIADDGNGLPRREKQVIDQRQETQLQHSRGMGLWLSTWVVESGGGTIEVDSSSEGTVVEIRLPTA